MPFQEAGNENEADDTNKKGGNVKFYAYSTKETVSGILVPTFDMGSDVATAVTHYKWANYGWCALTLCIVHKLRWKILASNLNQGGFFG